MLHSQENASEPLYENEHVMTLRQIDRYINDINRRDFKTALLELNKYLNKYPEQFDAVQRRYKKILGTRDQYVELANELMRLIRESSEEDSEKIDEQMMKLTDRILSLERNPGHEELEIVKDTNYLVSIRQYSAIQNKTAALVSSKNYAGAVTKANEGFGILHENFAARFDGQDIEQKVSSVCTDIGLLIEQYKLLQEKLNASVSLYEGYVAQENYGEAIASLSNLKDVFAEFARIRNKILEKGLELEKYSESVTKLTRNKKNDNNSDEDKFLKHGDEYLALATGTVFGWKDNPHPDHGILGVLDAHWNTCVEHMKKVTAEKMNENAILFCELSSVQAFRQNGTIPDKSKLEVVVNFSQCAKTVNGLYSLLLSKNGKNYLKPYSNYDVSIDFAKNICEQTEISVDNVLRIAEIKQKSDAVSEPENHGNSELQGSGFVPSIISVADEIADVVRTMNLNSSGNAFWGTLYKELLEKQTGAIEVSSERKTSGVQIDDKILVWDKIEKTSSEYSSATGDYADKSMSDIYVRAARHYAFCGTDYTDSAKAKYGQIMLEINGNPSESGKKYPKLAVTHLEELNKYISSCKKVLTSSSGVLRGKYASDYADHTLSINNSIQELDKIYSDNQLALNSANELIRAAGKEINQAEKAISQAQKLFRSKKYDEARKAANDALDLWRNSLKYNYDSEIDSGSEKTVIALLGEIAEQQKIVIENEVNELVSQADREYRNDNYTKAQNSLNQAQERWNIIYPDFVNYEITNLKTIVENALSANSGREVMPSDSLYLDVSQMLRSANQSFEKGQSLIKKGKTEESKLQFTDALNTLEILRSLVPRNQQANILRLKIQQIQNPEEFESNFSDRVNSAKADSKDKSKMVQAYSDLCDLQKIKPNYPGLAEIILDLEYKLGKRVKPIDNSVKKEAQALVVQAKNLYNKGNYAKAFEKINEALGKDNSNSEARTLRSQINRRMQATVSVRSPDLEDRYQEALEYSNASEYAKANDIVVELWKNPANRIEKLEKLKARIERWM